MSVDRNMLRAIARAVADAGGDVEDVRDLADVWERVERDQAPRVDRMRRLAASPVCCCRDGGDEPAPDGRCTRCWGRRVES